MLSNCNSILSLDLIINKMILSLSNYPSLEFLYLSNNNFNYLTAKLFQTQCNLQFIYISNGFSSNFTNIIFSNCKSLVSINFSNFACNYANMENLFYNFTSLISVDFSNFTSSNYTNMENMFYG